MYRVLLVDDELEIRNGMRLKIDWPALGFEVAGEAQDGREALAVLERERIDLILTDIRMPVMSGLELLKQCAENYVRVKTIVLSGYDDFHFVKAALQCGAKDYLLKPVVRSELSALLGKLREELDGERSAASTSEEARKRRDESLAVLREQLLLEWIGEDGDGRLSALRSEAKRLGMDGWLGDGTCMQLVSTEYRVPDGRLGERADGGGLFRLAYQLLFRETLQRFGWAAESAFAFYHRGYPTMMHAVIAAPTPEEGERRKEALCRDLQDHVRRYLRAEAVVGVGLPFVGAAGLRAGFLSALQAWSQSRSGAVSQIVSADAEPDDYGEPFPEAEKRLALALDNADLEAFSATAASVLAPGLHPVQGAAAFALRAVLLLDQAARKHRLDVPETQGWMFPDAAWRPLSGSSALPYLVGIASRVIEGIKGARLAGGASAVEEIRRTIDRSYMNELSLTMLADRFHLNPTYLSELFKKQTGSTFSDYVTQVRLSKAAELLRDPQMRLADIAELVGFANASYLSSVFKKQYGVSPNEYRQRPTAPPA